MFSFFRKHQRFFYTFLALFVATSLISFGTWRTSSSSGDEKHLFKTPGKHRHDKKDLEMLEIFLSREAMEGNPLNDGVISSNFLKSGLGDQLVAAFKKPIGGDLRAALPRELGWRPYLHPQLPHLNQKELWHLFCPSLAAHHEQFTSLSRKNDGDIERLFHIKRDLCLAQGELPAEQLRRAIWQQSSLQKIDARLAPGDLELFGYRDFRAWFGPNFMRLAAQVILLGAEESEKSGICVSEQEAKADLLAAAARLQLRAAGDQIAAIYRHCVQRAGLPEHQLLKCWRRILLFRHWIAARQQSWGLDASLALALDDFSKQEKRATFYTLDDSLRIKTPEQWEQFEIYCRLAARDALQTECLPRQFKEPHQLWEVAPHLLQSPCRASRLAVSRSQLRAELPQRRVMQYLLDEKNWDKVRAFAPKTVPAVSLEQRSRALDSLKSEERDRLDQWARAAILDGDPAIVERALQRPQEEIEWTLNGAGLDLPFSTVKKPREFVELIKKAWNLDASAAQDLLRYETDGDTILSLRILNSPKWGIVPWQKVCSKGLMKGLLEGKRPSKCSAAEIAKARQKAQSSAQEMGRPEAWLVSRALKSMELARDTLREKRAIPIASRAEEVLDFSTQWQLWEETEQITRGDFKAAEWPGLFSGGQDDRGWSKVQWQARVLGFYSVLEPSSLFEEGRSIPALDDELVLGSEQMRSLIANQLDREFANRWLSSQMGYLRPLWANCAPDGDSDRE